MRALKEKIRDDAWAADFEVYLTERFCPENIRFLQAVEKYRDAATDGDVEKSLELGNEIIDQFLRDDAPQELNLGFSHRSEAIQQLQSTEDGACPSPSAFDDAQVSIILLIMDYYKDFCSQAQALAPIKDAVDEPVHKPKEEARPSGGDAKDGDSHESGSCFDGLIGIFHKGR